MTRSAMVTRLCRVTREGWPGWPDKPRNQDHLEGDTKILLFCAFAVSELLLSGIAQGDAVCPASRDPNQSFLSKIPTINVLKTRFDWNSIYWCNFWGTQTRDSFTWTLKQVTMVTRHNTRERQNFLLLLFYYFIKIFNRHFAIDRNLSINCIHFGCW